METITAQTKVAAILEDPSLETVLLHVAPAFAKLKNPVLRRTMARVTSLRQAAEVANVKVATLVGALRQAAGQPGGVDEVEESNQQERPNWARAGAAVDTIDGNAIIAQGEHPLGAVQKALRGMQPGQVLALRSPFRPAPLIDMMQEQGHQVWSAVEKELHITWIRRASADSAAR